MKSCLEFCAKMDSAVKFSFHEKECCDLLKMPIMGIEGRKWWHRYHEFITSGAMNVLVNLLWL